MKILVVCCVFFMGARAMVLRETEETVPEEDAEEDMPDGLVLVQPEKGVYKNGEPIDIEVKEGAPAEPELPGKETIRDGIVSESLAESSASASEAAPQEDDEEEMTEPPTEVAPEDADVATQQQDDEDETAVSPTEVAPEVVSEDADESTQQEDGGEEMTEPSTEVAPTTNVIIVPAPISHHPLGSWNFWSQIIFVWH